MGETHHGAEGYRDWMTAMDEASESWEMRIEEMTAIDDDRVLCVWAGKIRGRQSGADVSQQGAAIMTVQGGKITRTEIYATPEQAREAAQSAASRTSSGSP